MEEEKGGATKTNQYFKAFIYVLPIYLDIKYTELLCVFFFKFTWTGAFTKRN